MSIDSKVTKKVIVFVQPVFIAYCIFDYFTSKQPSIGYYPAAAECIIMLSFIIYFFYELMEKVVAIPLYVTIEFWLAVALILYFSGNFFLFVYSRSMINDKGFLAMYKIVYSSIIIIKNIFICIAIIFKANLENTKRSDDFFDPKLDSFLH